MCLLLSLEQGTWRPLDKFEMCLRGPRAREKGESKATAPLLSPRSPPAPAPGRELVMLNCECPLSCLPPQLDLETSFRLSGSCTHCPCRKPGTWSMLDKRSGERMKD